MSKHYHTNRHSKKLTKSYKTAKIRLKLRSKSLMINAIHAKIRSFNFINPWSVLAFWRTLIFTFLNAYFVRFQAKAVTSSSYHVGNRKTNVTSKKNIHFKFVTMHAKNKTNNYADNFLIPLDFTDPMLINKFSSPSLTSATHRTCRNTSIDMQKKNVLPLIWKDLIQWN